MKFVVKHLFKFLFFVVVATLAYEIAAANYRHSAQQKYQDPRIALMTHLNLTKTVAQTCIQTVVDRNWTKFELVQKFLFAFHNRIYWLGLGLFVLICYYELRSRQSQPKVTTHNNKIGAIEFEKMKKQMTISEVDKLVNSKAYQ